MRDMTGKVMHSDTLVTYLTATIICNNVIRVMTTYYIAQYSAGFGGSNILQRDTVALLGEMVRDQLPKLIRFDSDPAMDFAHALGMEAQ
jgi:hypothetical protein